MCIRDSTSEWAKRENNRVKGRRYNISSELLHPEDRPRRREKGRTLNVYTLSLIHI